MTLKSKLYRSADYDSKWLSAEMGQSIPAGKCGYALMGDKLVPYSLIDRFVNRFMSIGFGYGEVLSVRDACGEEFWDSLDESEREVAGDILLMLVEVGRFDIALDDSLQDGAKQDHSVMPYRDDMVYNEPRFCWPEREPEQGQEPESEPKQEPKQEPVAVGS